MAFQSAWHRVWHKYMLSSGEDASDVMMMTMAMAMDHGDMLFGSLGETTG